MSTGSGTRSRSGCKTCRTRKLKCDETKPICGQCRKSNRECVPSEGIAFRHAQNAGFSGAGGRDLANFYKYRQKFDNTYFLPVPKELSFVHITDPYASDYPPNSHSQSMRMPQVPPLPDLPQDSSYGPAYALAGIEEHVTVAPQYVDVAASSLKAMIDPNLEATTHASMGGEHHPPHQSGYAEGQSDSYGNASADGTYREHDDAMHEENINETILKALQNTQEQVKSM